MRQADGFVTSRMGMGHARCLCDLNDSPATCCMGVLSLG